MDGRCRLACMQLERGTIGPLPFAALGTGDPVLVIAGLFPVTGPGGDRMARAMIGSLAKLAVALGQLERLQRRIAARIRAGAHRQAIALLAGEIVPRGRLAAGIVASIVGPLVLRDMQGMDDMAT